MGTDLSVFENEITPPQTEAELPDDEAALVTLGQQCLSVGKIATCTFALVCRKMHRRGRKLREIAEKLGCSYGTVQRAVMILNKITNDPDGVNDDLEGTYDEGMRELRAREAPKSERQALPEWDIEHEQDEFRARQPDAAPLDNYTNEKALRDSIGSFCRIVADMASFVTDTDQKKQLRESLIREIEAILR